MAEMQKKQAEEQKRRLEEIKRKQVEENKRKLEEANMKRIQDQQRQLEEQKRKEEEMRKRQEVEAMRKIEQKSTLAIRRVIQKVRAATPETFDELNKELQEVTTAELETCGSQKQRIVEESEKGLEMARKRIEQINEQRRKEEERKKEEEKKRVDAELRAKELVQELGVLVDNAEKSSAKIKEVAGPLLDDKAAEQSAGEVEQSAKAVDEACSEAKVTTKACTDFILSRGTEMKDTSRTVPGQPPSETKQLLAKLLQRINECTRASDATALAAKGAKEKAAKRAAARGLTQDMQAVFDKYDKDKDKALSRKEVIAYAKGEFKFDLPPAIVESHWKLNVAQDAKGVPIEQFQGLKVAVGVAREMQRDKLRIQERAAKEQVILKMKAELKEKVQNAAKAVDDADKDVAKCEKQVQPLTQKAKSMAVADMTKLADETDKMIKEAEESASSARAQVAALSENIDEHFKVHLQAFLASEAKSIDMKLGRMDSRIGRAQNLSMRFRDQATKKVTVELEKLKGQVLKVLQYNKRTKRLNDEEMFHEIDTKKDGSIDEGEFLAYWKGMNKVIKDEPLELTAEEKASMEEGKKESKEEGDAKKGEEAKDGDSAKADANAEEKKEESGGDAAKTEEKPAPAPEEPKEENVDISNEDIVRVFAFIKDGEEDCDTLSKDAFIRFVRVYMKVVKDTVLTESFGINSGKTLRRLDIGEVVEVLRGPLRELSVDVMRIRAKVFKDNTEGWITVAGNQGTAFLKEGGQFFKVVKETILTDEFELDSDKDKESTRKLKNTTRKLKEGEILEVYEWPRKEEKTGLVRMRGRVKSDGATGWASTMSSTGAVFIEVV